MTDTTLVLVGSGQWGQKYIATLSEFSNVRLIVADRNNWKNLVKAKPDGVIVCTPPDSHIEIAEYVLARDIPAIIEKPLSLSLAEAERLQPYKAPILVNHIHLFSDGYQKIKGTISGKKIALINSSGCGNGPIRTYSSLWDYGPHDISMILDLAGCVPNKVTVIQLQSSKAQSLFKIQMYFDSFWTNSVIGNGADVRSRTLAVDCGGTTFTYDDKKPSPLEQTPPLTNALRVFIDAIHGRKDERLGLDLSLKVMKIIEYCQRSLDVGDSAGIRRNFL